MTDRSISVSAIITAAAWMVAAVIFVAMWIVWAFGPHKVAYVLGLTLIPVSTVAGVWQIRCGQLRMCALMRAVGGLEQPKDTHLQSLR